MWYGAAVLRSNEFLENMHRSQQIIANSILIEIVVLLKLYRKLIEILKIHAFVEVEKVPAHHISSAKLHLYLLISTVKQLETHLAYNGLVFLHAPFNQKAFALMVIPPYFFYLSLFIMHLPTLELNTQGY